MCLPRTEVCISWVVTSYLLSVLIWFIKLPCFVFGIFLSVLEALVSDQKITGFDSRCSLFPTRMYSNNSQVFCWTELHSASLNFLVFRVELTHLIGAVVAPAVTLHAISDPCAEEVQNCHFLPMVTLCSQPSWIVPSWLGSSRKTNHRNGWTWSFWVLFPCEQFVRPLEVRVLVHWL